MSLELPLQFRILQKVWGKDREEKCETLLSILAGGTHA